MLCSDGCSVGRALSWIPIEIRNRAIIALLNTTGIRVAALRTLRGKHVNIWTRCIKQDPCEVSTKFGKHIRAYCLDLGSGLPDAILDWPRWRQAHGFGADAPFFLPDRYMQPNGMGLGYRSAQTDAPECVKSDAPSQRIIRNAAQAAGISEESISSHGFRKVLHPFISNQGNMMIIKEVPLQFNLGHTPTEMIRKHYASMQDDERQAILDELCLRALSHRSNVELYLAIERNWITEADPDYTRAKRVDERNAAG
jgi:integrase